MKQLFEILAAILVLFTVGACAHKGYGNRVSNDETQEYVGTLVVLKHGKA